MENEERLYMTMARTNINKNKEKEKEIYIADFWLQYDDGSITLSAHASKENLIKYYEKLDYKYDKDKDLLIGESYERISIKTISFFV